MAGVGELSRSRALVVVPPPPAVDAAPSLWQRLKPPRRAFALSVAARGLHAGVFGAAVSWARSLALGAPMGLAAFDWMAWAWVAFRRAGTRLRPTGRPAMLVEQGPFRFGRNPMYLGIAAR